MAATTETPEKAAWHARFVEHLHPAEQMGELLFGLIMVLTFTLGAGIGLADREESHELLLAALGCNAAWGIIDAALYLIARLSERGRLHHLVRSIQSAPSREDALALVESELDERLPPIVRPEVRAQFDTHVLERVRALPPERNRVTAADLQAGFAVFCLVFLTALPAVVPFLLIPDPGIAMRASNAVLIGLVFFVGWRWAGYTGASPWRTGIFFALLGVALVAVAIALGG